MSQITTITDAETLRAIQILNHAMRYAVKVARAHSDMWVAYSGLSEFDKAAEVNYVRRGFEDAWYVLKDALAAVTGEK